MISSRIGEFDLRHDNSAIDCGVGSEGSIRRPTTLVAISLDAKSVS